MAGIQVLPNGYISSGVVDLAPIQSQYDATANDSDKSFTVPGNEMWRLNFATVILATTAAAGNRVLTLTVTDPSGNVIATSVAGAVQAASGTVTYEFCDGLARETSVVNASLRCGIPAELWLEPGAVLRIYDSAAIAADADDMTVSFQYKKYTV